MKIVHASISENGNAGKDGKAKAGDQNGKEVCLREFYSKPWDYYLRYAYDSTLGNRIAEIAVLLAESNLVGYDQTQRNTLYHALECHNWNVGEYIMSGEKTECDCSSFLYAVCCCLLPTMRGQKNAPTTNTMKDFYSTRGFYVLSGKNANTTNDHLNGDIFVKVGSHCAMVCYEPERNTTYNPNITPKELDDALQIVAKYVKIGYFKNMPDRKELIYKAVQERV